jgi:germination protein M
MRKWLVIVLCLLCTIVFSACSSLNANTDSTLATGAAQTSISVSDTPDSTVAQVDITDPGKKVSINLYYANTDDSAVVEENRDISVKDGAIIKAAAMALIAGPADQTLKKIIPDGTKLLGVNKKGNVAIVDFSKEFADGLSDSEGVLERASVVNTLTQLADVEKVRILIEGKPITDASGVALGDMSRTDIDNQGNSIAQ